MTAAIFGLVGVLVGGLLNGAVARWQARRTESDAVRAAARMMLNEAINVTVAAEEIAKARLWPTRQYWPTVIARWGEHEGLLAGALTFDDWASVSHAVRALERIDVEDVETGGRVDDRRTTSLESVGTAFAEALPVLTRLSDMGTRPTARQRIARARRRAQGARRFLRAP
jgi:hypothetical protein